MVWAIVLLVGVALAAVVWLGVNATLDAIDDRPQI